MVIKKKIKAICIKCGMPKPHRFSKCENCGFNPKGNNEEMAKSIILSSRFDPVNDKLVFHSDELYQIGEKIRNGEPFKYDEEEIRKLLREKELFDSASPKDIIKLIFIILITFGIGLSGFYVFIKYIIKHVYY